MAPPSSRRLFLGLLLLSLFQGLQSLKDYHNIFCGKENCYDVLGVPQVSSSPCPSDDGGSIHSLCVRVHLFPFDPKGMHGAARLAYLSLDK